MADSQDRFFDQLSAFLGVQQTGIAPATVPASTNGPAMDELVALLQAPRLNEVRFQGGQLVYFDGAVFQPIVATRPRTGIRFPLTFPITF